MTEKARPRYEATRPKYEAMIGPIREKARQLGYALGVHGSLERDIDLIACPWTEEAVPAKELAEAIRQTAAEHNGGIAFMKSLEAEDEFHQNGCPGMKAHGRLVWSFHLGGGPYIDLSVMPRWQEARKAGIREGFEKARLAFRMDGPCAEIPGIITELPGNNAFVYDDADDYLAGDLG